MRNTLVAVLTGCLIMSTGGVSVGCRTSPAEAADLVLLGGNLVTLDDVSPRAEALAAKGDRIVALDTNEQIRTRIGRQTKVIELHGRTVVPGMIDAHVHFLGIGARKLQIDASGAAAKEEIVAKVAAQVAQSQAGAWIQGRREKLKGSLTPGKLADVVILSRDIMSISPPEILETEIFTTILGGKVVYQKED